MGVGHAPGKVILVGEHFVVHGTPAIALPLLGRGVRVETQREGGAWEMPEHVARHVSRLLDELGEEAHSLTIRVSSDLPIGAGLGGSAAIAVALVRALYSEQTLSHEEVRALAHRLETLAHGNPSGIDDAVATYACPVRYVKGGVPEPLTDLVSPSLWVGLSAERTSTLDAVAQVGELARSRPGWFEGVLEKARVVADKAGLALEGSQWSELGSLMTDNHRLLQKVGVSTESLDRLVDSALGAGAYGAKLTGGGLGGAVIALTPEGLDLTDVWREAGAQEVIES